jgi:hypothetical protein
MQFPVHQTGQGENLQDQLDLKSVTTTLEMHDFYQYFFFCYNYTKQLNSLK